MNPLLKKILTPLASLRITVALLLGTMLLVYVGTLAQQTQDNFTVQKEYFHCWFAYMPLANHIPFGDLHLSGGYLFLGGYSLITGILINLIAAHWLRFKFAKGDLVLVPVLALAGFLTWKAQGNPDTMYVTLTCLAGLAALILTFVFHGKRTGVIVIHFGLILILVGEMVSAMARTESQMTIIEGETQNWTQDVLNSELAVIDPAPADHDHVVTVPWTKLSPGMTLSDSALPFEVRVDAYYRNANLADARTTPAPFPATAGQGTQRSLVPLRLFTGAGADAERVNAPAAYITVFKGGKQLDTLMLSTMLPDSQRIQVDGKPYDVALRFKRFYKPYSIHLIDFKHEKYEGTDKAKNFQAHLQLTDPPNGVNWDMTVRMNQPLRYAGDTIYQSGFNPEIPNLTTLQVVRNPGWLMPYLACAIGGLGMVIHFGIVLISFLDRTIRTPSRGMMYLIGFLVGGPIGLAIVWIVLRYARPANKPAPASVLPAMPQGAYTLEPKRRSLGWVIPAGLAALAVFYAVVYALPRTVTPPDRKDYALEEWGKLPINFDGRVMPLDSLARNSLKVIYGKQTFTIEEKDSAGNKTQRKAQAIEWLADTMSGMPVTPDLKVLRIDEPQVKAFFGLPPEEKEFSYAQLLPNRDPLTMSPPAAWKPVAPSQFEMVRFEANAEGSALVSVSELPDQSELEAQNLIRWAGQVGLPPPNPQTLASQLSMTTLGGGNARRVDYVGPGTADSPPLRSVIVYANRMKKTYVVKIMGLAPAVGEALSQFEGFVDTVHFNERMEKLGDELTRLNAKREANRNSLDLYERKMLELGSHITLFNRLAQPRSMYAVPPLAPGQVWRTLNEARIAKRDTLAPEPAMENFIVATAAWRDGQAGEFNKAVTAYQKLLEQQAPELAAKSSFETFYNRFSPFWVSVGLYIFVLVLGCISWMFLGGPLARGALAVLIVSFLIHSFGIVSRIYISGRPPVTNLYSSAVFIAWVVVLVCILIEWVFKNGLALVVAGLVGFLSLLVADGIEFVDAVSRNEGDTMAQLQAVLDTNFWLATHVVMITMGYAATFLAGFLGIFYVVGAMVSRLGTTEADGRQSGLSAIFNGPLGMVFSEENRRLYARLVYGVICFAMLLSFVGTILGGIWADQSWGRFWGWDSKENGAILIVLWNAIILHARWGGMIKERGIMSLTIIGNIVTAWSWFGTNELGIGLHSYGFTEGVVPKLLAFWSAMAVLAIVGVTPLATWRNFKWIGPAR